MKEVFLVGLTLCSACASPVSDIQLAPLFSRQTVPDFTTLEIAGGLISTSQTDYGTAWSAGPLAGGEQDSDGKMRMDFLWPLGRFEQDLSRPRSLSRLWPVFWARRDTRADGVEEYDWNIFGFLHGGSSSTKDEESFAFFPFYGKLNDFLTWDEIEFHLFPFHVTTKKDGVTSRNFLFPLVSRTEGPGVRGWKLFPFAGRKKRDGSYQRDFLFWPFWHRWQENLSGEVRHGWFLFPIAGHIKQGDYEATTAVWPFLGWASRPSTNYQAWSIWPLLKHEQGGIAKDREVKRILPFLLRHKDATGETTSWLWPLIWHREFNYTNMQGDSSHVFPFFHKGSRRFADGSKEELLHLWPLGIHIETPQRKLLALPSLGSAADKRLGFIYQAWRDSSENETRDRRLWLGLYRKIESSGHSRWSIPILGGVWEEPNGTRHHSWLGGLLRWQTGPRGVAMEAPAFPGPGWPTLASTETTKRQ